MCWNINDRHVYSAITHLNVWSGHKYRLKILTFISLQPKIFPQNLNFYWEWFLFECCSQRLRRQSQLSWIFFSRVWRSWICSERVRFWFPRFERVRFWFSGFERFWFWFSVWFWCPGVRGTNIQLQPIQQDHSSARRKYWDRRTVKVSLLFVVDLLIV